MTLRFSILISLTVFLGQARSQTDIKKYAVAGSYISVPVDKRWEINRSFINDGMYNVIINKSNFRQFYQSNDTIRFPYYIAEMEMLSKPSSCNFILEITETDIP
jgi:hypothetical protein